MLRGILQPQIGELLSVETCRVIVATSEWPTLHLVATNNEVESNPTMAKGKPERQYTITAMGTIIMALATLARLLPTMAIGTTSTSGPMTHHLLVVIDHQGGVLTTGCQHAKQVKQCSPNSMQEDRIPKT